MLENKKTNVAMIETVIAKESPFQSRKRKKEICLAGMGIYNHSSITGLVEGVKSNKVRRNVINKHIRIGGRDKTIKGIV